MTERSGMGASPVHHHKPPINIRDLQKSSAAEEQRPKPTKWSPKPLQLYLQIPQRLTYRPMVEPSTKPNRRPSRSPSRSRSESLSKSLRPRHLTRSAMPPSNCCTLQLRQQLCLSLDPRVKLQSIHRQTSLQRSRETILQGAKSVRSRSREKVAAGHPTLPSHPTLPTRTMAGQRQPSGQRRLLQLTATKPHLFQPQRQRNRGVTLACLRRAALIELRLTRQQCNKEVLDAPLSQMPQQRSTARHLLRTLIYVPLAAVTIALATSAHAALTIERTERRAQALTIDRSGTGARALDGGRQRMAQAQVGRPETCLAKAVATAIATPRTVGV